MGGIVESTGLGPIVAGRFQLSKLLDQGLGISTYLGEDLESGETVVVKTVLDAVLSRAIRLRVGREAAILCGNWQGNDRPVLAYGSERGASYLVMPRIPGVTLEERLKEGALSPDETLIVALGMLETLSQAHEVGVLHRAIKPSNVIVGDTSDGTSDGTPDGTSDGPSEDMSEDTSDGACPGASQIKRITRATLIDFGLSRSWARDRSQGGQMALEVARYASPELAGLIDRPTDERSDLYSTGLVLYECLAGRPAFAGTSLGETLRQHLEATLPVLGSLGLPVPRQLDEVLERMLRKDPRDRYQTARGVLADLQGIARSLERGPLAPPVVIGREDRRRTLTEPAFVGRTAELDRLCDHLAAARQGRGGLVTVESESGGGKSSLLAELALRGAGVGARVFRGQGVDQAAMRPFQLLEGVAEDIGATARLAPALGEGLGDGLGEGLADRLGDLREAVCDALPELEAVLGPRSVGSLGPEAFGEIRTLRALSALLDAVGSPPNPALIVLDDCQWADGLTLRLLDHWSGTPEPGTGAAGGSIGRHTVIVAAFRSDEVGPEHPLRLVSVAGHLKLPPLSPDELTEVAESMAGPLPAEAIGLVETLSGGSPFMAGAVLRGLVEAGALEPGKDSWELDPLALTELASSRQAADFLSRRIARLPEQDRRVLEFGAILGKRFDLEAVSAVAEVPLEQTAACLEEGRRRHLVWSRGEGDRFAFVHDKIREALLAELPDYERRRIHRLAANHFKAVGKPSAFDLAFHLDAAGEVGEALPHALEAAREARARNALETAERFYRIAERGSDTASPGALVEVTEGLGDILMLQGNYQEAARQYRKAKELATDSLDLARLQARIGELSFKRGEVREAIDALEQALSAIGRSVPRGRLRLLAAAAKEGAVQIAHTLAPGWFLGRRPAPPDARDKLAMQCYSRLAHAHWFGSGTSACLWAHLRGMNLAERYGPSAELAQAYSEHAPAMTMVGAFRRGIRYAERSLAIRRDLEDLWGQGQSLHFLGVVLYAASRYTECLERCREAVRILDRTGDRWEVNTASWHVAYSLYRLGDLAGAVEAAHEVHEAGRRIGDAQATGISLSVWAKAAGGRMPDDILVQPADGLASDVHTYAELKQATALRLLAQERYRDAAAVLRAAQERIDRAGFRQEYVSPVPAWLATALRLETEQAGPLAGRRFKAKLGEARKAARRAVRVARTFRNNLPHALRERGLIEALAGHSAQAIRYLDRSLDIARRQEAQYEEAQTRLERCRLEVAQGVAGAGERLDAAIRGMEILERGAGEVRTKQDGHGFEPTLSLADRFDGVLEAGRTISRALENGQVCSAVREAGRLLLRGDQILVLSAGPDGLAAPLPGQDDLPFDADLVARAIVTERPATWAAEPSERAAFGVRPGVRSALCAPIMVRGRPVACLYATHSRIGGLFGLEETRLAEFIAIMAGVALENAEGFEQVQALSRTLEGKVEERTLELSLANQELQVANVRLQELDRFKDSFFSMVSHELRTPLQSIIGYCNLIQDGIYGDVPPSLGQPFGIVMERSETLHALIGDLLDLAAIRAGRFTINKQDADLADIMLDAICTVEPIARARRISLELKAEAALPAIQGDPHRLLQVLVNLLANAIKFTSEGGQVELGSRSEPDGARLWVKDTGIGIPVEHRAAIFEAFGQAPGTARARGTGLGLTVARHIVEAHAGSIEVESEVGRGTTFVVFLPRELKLD